MLDKFEFLEHLDVKQNNLRSLPDKLYSLSKLISIDLTENPIEDLERTFKALSTIPSLTELFIDLSSVQDVQLVMKYLPTLDLLNGNPVHEIDEANNNVDDVEFDIQQKDLENVADLYDKVRNYLKGNGVGNDREYAADFDTLSQKVTDELRSLVSDNINEYSKRGCIAKNKFLM